MEILQIIVPVLKETWVLSILCALLPFLLYFVNARIFRKQAAHREYTSCDSPECVRCTKYQAIRSQAFNKLCEFIQRENILKGLERIIEAVQTNGNTDKHPEQKPNVVYVPGLKALPWWTKDAFEDDVKLLERNTNIIHTEYKIIHEDLMEGNTSGWAQNKTQSGQWNVYYFYNQGVKNEINCVRCPRTSAILDQIHNLMRGSLFLNVSFSVLRTDTTIDEHYGPTNTRIRCHLGLDIPDQCTLIVAGKSKSWDRGKCLIFDDSFLHSAQNANIQKCSRVVLLIDFWHPQLTNLEREALMYTF